MAGRLDTEGAMRFLCRTRRLHDRWLASKTYSESMRKTYSESLLESRKPNFLFTITYPNRKQIIAKETENAPHNTTPSAKVKGACESTAKAPAKANLDYDRKDQLKINSFLKPLTSFRSVAWHTAGLASFFSTPELPKDLFQDPPRGVQWTTPHYL